MTLYSLSLVTRYDLIYVTGHCQGPCIVCHWSLAMTLCTVARTLHYVTGHNLGPCIVCHWSLAMTLFVSLVTI